MELSYKKDDIQSAVLAALLHDVGKFQQRSMTHQRKHPEMGRKFILRTMGSSWEKVANIVSAHHDPSSYSQGEELTKLVAVADWLSASERENLKKEEEKDREDVRSYFIHSIFSKLLIDGKHYRKKPAIYPLQGLSNSLEDCFPVDYGLKGAGEKRVNISKYKKLWDSFESEFKNIDFNSVIDFKSNDSIITSILALLEKYTTFIPSAAYKSNPDISLFLHSKSVGALASCLLNQIPLEDIDKYYQEIKNHNYKEFARKNIFRLLLCDLSGIQDFLYAIPPEHALKNLKGRSAYIQLLSESIARYILSRYNLPVINILFIGGGNFYLLLPTQADDMAQLKKEVADFLFEKEKIDVFPAIESVLLSPVDFLQGKLGEKWFEVNKKVAIEKRRKNKFVFADEVKSSSFLNSLEGSRNDNSHKYEKIAKQIPNADWLYLGTSTSDGIKIIDTIWSFTKEKDENKNGFSINKYIKIDKNCKGHYRLANHTASDEVEQRAATLEDLANRCDAGKKTWGVIRADVDHLGKIFREGLNEDTEDTEEANLISISRITTLSNMFSIFFSSHLQSILQKEEYREKTVIVYSGGDDLFIIGAWDILVDLMYDIRTDFQKFTFRNDITFSAAIYIAPSAKFPVIEAAKEAGRMLKKAKDAGRNRICFIDDKPLTWGELDEIRDVKQQILSWIDKPSDSSGEARSLIRILKESLNYNDGDEKDLSHIYRFMYSIKRWTERQKFIKDDDLTDLRNTFVIDYKFRENLIYAVRWAELLKRQET